MRITPDWSLVTMIAVCLVGCSGGDGPRPAGGVVTYNGKPLAGAEVVFAPQDGSRVAQATTDEAGQFELGTFQPGDGALVAQHRVTVIARGPAKPPQPGTPASLMPDEFVQPGEPLIPTRYFTAEASGLTAEVARGGKNSFTFSLTD